MEKTSRYSKSLQFRARRTTIQVSTALGKVAINPEWEPLGVLTRVLKHDWEFSWKLGMDKAFQVEGIVNTKV